MEEKKKAKTIPVKTSGGVRYVSESNIVRFPDGLLGFDEYTDFVFFDIEGCEPFRSMLSVKEGGPDFVTVEPLGIFDDYKPLDDVSSCESLDMTRPAEYAVLSIVTLSENPEDITVNLRAPLIINLTTSIGKQIILNDDSYPTRQQLYVSA